MHRRGVVQETTLPIIPFLLNDYSDSVIERCFYSDSFIGKILIQANKTLSQLLRFR